MRCGNGLPILSYVALPIITGLLYVCSLNQSKSSLMCHSSLFSKPISLFFPFAAIIDISICKAPLNCLYLVYIRGCTLVNNFLIKYRKRTRHYSLVLRKPAYYKGLPCSHKRFPSSLSIMIGIAFSSAARK
ncbi:hypothetical protein BC01_028 [Bacillus phage BC01]|nr:hypothetical protein BC01_028 [Bacillus phage BC01]